ncbi:MAG: hypothetical protein R3F55_17860 [Alphaproteobacteria bacterium]
MKNLLDNLFAGLIVLALTLVAIGLLSAAAVVGFAALVGTGGALAIVGAILIVLALLVALVMRGRGRPTVADRHGNGLDAGGIAAGFVLGLWDGFTRPRRPPPPDGQPRAEP